MLQALILASDAVAAALLVGFSNWVGLIPFRRARGLHWSERARVLYPARVGAVTAVWLLPVIVALAQTFDSSGRMPHWALAGAAAWLGAVGGSYPFQREVLPWLGPKLWLRQVFANWLIRFPMLFLLVGIAVMMPENLDYRGWLLAAVFALAFVAWCWGGLLWLSRMLGVLRPAPERLRRVVLETSKRMGIPVRNVWLMHSAYSMAFALPYTGDLLFTERLLERHSDEEVSAICAHEIGHLQEPTSIVWARVFGNLAWLMPWMFLKPTVHAFQLPGGVGLALVSLFVMIANRRLSRRLETRADRVAHSNEGETGAYARALARLYEDNLIPAVLPRKARSHPDLYDRLLALGVQPEFAKPKPAKSNGLNVFILVAVLAALLVLKLARVMAQ